MSFTSSPLKTLFIFSCINCVALADVKKCESKLDPQEWRAEQSVSALPSNQDLSTDGTREAELQRLTKPMLDEINVNHDTPEIELLAENQVTQTVVSANRQYGSGKLLRLKFSDVGSEGLLKATMILPVSGHVGIENAKKWALTDTYSLQLQTRAGTKTLVKNQKSLGMLTYQDLVIPLVKDEVIQIQYLRSGSGGPSGYIEGRVIELVWDGT